ncbi:MAG TPA: phosphatase PAP2 family protein [Phycisphaerae bacterium]|nr:phosphatase PAP2 family protein [Phycisphaerae bacterium]HRY68318.1 phosphatase PAP2 family protein [Phycisphaerae bacterium]HSA26799.1 phosphatase PAP2 family protein [Phycisphaerae bacterium]
MSNANEMQEREVLAPPPTEVVRSSPRGRLPRWDRVSVFFLVAVAGYLILLNQDLPLMRIRYTLIPGEPQDWLKEVLGSVREFGQAGAVILAIAIAASYDRRWKPVVCALLLAEALAAAGYDSGKYFLPRHRPYAATRQHAEGSATPGLQALQRFTVSDTWLGSRPSGHGFDTESFPSGHSASSFAIACVLSCYYPRLAWLLWPLAFGCAASRYLEAVHWLSDCWLGAFWGYLSGRLALFIVVRGGAMSGRAHSCSLP